MLFNIEWFTYLRCDQNFVLLTWRRLIADVTEKRPEHNSHSAFIHGVFIIHYPLSRCRKTGTANSEGSHVEMPEPVHSWWMLKVGSSRYTDYEPMYFSHVILYANILAPSEITFLIATDDSRRWRSSSLVLVVVEGDAPLTLTDRIITFIDVERNREKRPGSGLQVSINNWTGSYLVPQF